MLRVLTESGIVFQIDTSILVKDFFIFSVVENLTEKHSFTDSSESIIIPKYFTFKKYTAHKMLASDQAPYWREKEKKFGVGGKKMASEVSREVVWGEERTAEPGDMPLMPPIRPPAINLSLKCEHVKFSSRMSA